MMRAANRRRGIGAAFVAMMASVLTIVGFVAPVALYAADDQTTLIPDYQLASGDRIRIVVFGHDDLSGELQLDGAGRLSLPLIGVLDAAGLTTRELERAITSQLKPDYLLDPRVSVEILGYRPIYIIGEVRAPGSYAFVSGMTVVNAVALAGGYTYRAARRKMTVTRASDTEKNKRRIGEGTRIYPGDVIEVPERFF